MKIIGEGQVEKMGIKMTLGRRIALIPLLLFCVFSLSGCVNPYLWGAALLVAGTIAAVATHWPS